jgi:hypothetical protein
MTRPLLEVADIVRAQGNRFIQTSCRWIHWSHRKLLQAIARCRCGYRAISFNSCRNRNCPKCQSGARDQWIMARQSELLPVPYVHVVFTLPHQLSPLALQNKKVLYDLLFRASAETLQEVARDPRHLGADIGFLSVLHTWGQNLLHHPHLHCVIPAGGLPPDGTRWIHPRYPLFLPVHVLSRVFRGKFVAGLKRRFQQNQLIFAGVLKPLENEKAFRSFLRPLFRQNWVVYAKPPFGGPHHVLGYLARYPHRVAITNHRLVAFEHDQVTFRWKDYAHGNKKRMMTLGCSVRKSSCAASCSTSCPAALSASAFSGSWLIGGAPLSYPSVSACSPTIRRRTHPQPSLLPPLSPLVSAAQNVPLPCLSSKDSLSFLLGNSRPGARTLTLLNHPTMLLSTARASAPTGVVSVLTEIHLNPPLTFLNYPHRTASSDLPTLSPTSFTSPLNPTLRRTNRESRMQNP